MDDLPPGFEDWTAGAEEHMRQKANGAGGKGTDHGGERNKFALIPFGKIEVDGEPPWLVDRLIPAAGLTVVWGAPKSGKTFLVADLALHVAMGWTYRDRDVRQGPVVYVITEGARGFKARAVAWRQHHLNGSGEAPEFYVIAASLDLIGEHAALVAAIRAQLGDVEPVLIVVDTLNRTLAGSESSDEDMSAYVRAVDAVRDAFACAVLVIHHCGHDATRPRGHTSLIGALDAQIAVKRDAAGLVVATVEAMKDGETGDTIVSTLRPVTVGEDKNGRAITSCVIEASDADPGKSGKPEHKLTPKERDWLAAITTWFARSDIEIPLVKPEAGSVTLRAGTRDQIRDWLRHRGCLDVTPGVTLDNKHRQELHKVLSGLRSKGKIGMTDRYVWLVK